MTTAINNHRPVEEKWRGALTPEEQDRFLFLRTHDPQTGFHVGLAPEHSAEFSELNRKISHHAERLNALEQPVVRLRCCVCGASTHGRQWWNRDEGFGLCNACATQLGEVEGREEMRLRYGYSGIHYAIPQARIAWFTVTAAHYDDMLCCLPPVIRRAGAFLVGEPEDHWSDNGSPRYRCLWEKLDGRVVSHLKSNRPVTVAEFDLLFPPQDA